MDLATIKKALRLLGIQNLSVKFDPSAEIVRASFNYLGQHQEGTISFRDIENTLTDSQNTHEKAQQDHVPTKYG